MNNTDFKRNLHRQVVDSIGLNIISGKFEIGDALPNEADLSNKFGVSRTVIREAIKVLNEKGLVESRPKVGTLVQPRQKWKQLDPDVLNWEYEAGPHDQFLQKLTEVRHIIEPAAARLAAQRATDDEIMVIQGFYDEMVRCLNDIHEYIPVDIQFHTAIVKASHNELLEQIVTTIRAALVSSRKVTTQLPDSAHQALPLHYAVLEAIQHRQPDTAYRAMEKLIERAAADIERILGPKKD